MIGRRPGDSPRSPLSRWMESVSDTGHLTLDTVVAYVDGELPAASAQRATTHVDRCLSCATEVGAQRQARGRLRGAETPGAPSTLLSSLRAIPDTAPPGAPADPAAAGPDPARDTTLGWRRGPRPR